MQYVVNDQTGIIQRWGSAGQEASFWERLIEWPELPDPAAVYWDGAAWQPYPQRPGEWAVWTGTEWADPRTEADREGERQAHRAATYLTKSEFLQACMATGLLTPSEAAVAAKGDIPAPFLPAVASMTPEQKDMLPVIWPAVTRINRMDPLILAVAKGASISEETLDALFGLAPTP